MSYIHASERILMWKDKTFTSPEIEPFFVVIFYRLVRAPYYSIDYGISP